MTDGRAPEGIDPDAVTAWLADRVEAVQPPLTFAVIEGGRSNLTYTVSDTTGRRWVLRRPPLHSVLPSAHDVGREHRVMAALADTPVPVPAMVGHESDPSVIGTGFVVMEHVDGQVVRDEQAAREVLGLDQRQRAGRSLVDVLVDLHAVDPDEVGLGDLARREDHLARQLHRWRGQLHRGRQQHGARELPLLDEVHDRLARDIPEQGEATIVHGDYRLDNLVLGAEGDVRAVLDWELTTLGDPLADVGLLAVYWSDPGDEMVPLISAPTVADGFPRRAEVLSRYADRSGRDLSALDYHVAFGCWKLAVILEGVRARFASGAYGDADDGSWRPFGDVVEQLAERARDAAGAAGR